MTPIANTISKAFAAPGWNELRPRALGLLLLLPERQQSLRCRTADYAGDADRDLPQRHRKGAGLTWASPFGALTVDYAIPLSKAAYDVVQPLRFSAGGF
jgi:hypothetical protein